LGKLRYAWQSDYLAKRLQEVLVWLVLTYRALSLVQAAEYQPALFAKRTDLELRLGCHGWVIHVCVTSFLMKNGTTRRGCLRAFSASA
jgi:hypothetical protein